MEATAAATTTKVEVKVEFPMSDKPPFHDAYPRDTTIGVVRADAMRHFEAREEPGSEYFLTNDRDHDRQLPDADSVGVVAEHADALQLTLVKELIQG